MKSCRKPPAFYVPIQLDLSVLPETYHWPACYFLNLIHWRSCTWRHNEQMFCQLKWEYLTKIIPRSIWRDLYNTLDSKAIIETDLIVSAGEKCRGYKLSEKYRQTHRIICTDTKFCRKIWKLEDRNNKNKIAIHHWLQNKFDSLKFDLEKAEPIIQSLKPDDLRTTVEDHHQNMADLCKKFKNKDHWFTTCKVGRFHTPITNLPTELRCCITSQNEHLVNIDLANSQPLLLGMIARQYYSSYRHRSRFIDECIGRVKSTYNKFTVNQKIIDDLTPNDVVKYIKVCEKGIFYESMMENNDSRDKFKVKFFEVLFGKIDKDRKNILCNRMRTLYPSVLKVLEELKKKDYKKSSYVLQNYEATLFIGIICKRIMEEKPNINIYTIHDSLLVFPRDVQYVKNIIIEEFNILGTHPKLKEEYYK